MCGFPGVSLRKKSTGIVNNKLAQTGQRRHFQSIASSFCYYWQLVLSLKLSVDSPSAH